MNIDQEALVAQTDKGYIKLMKNPKNFAWEIKEFVNTTKEEMIKLKKQIDELNEEMVKTYGNINE
jgi:uncharacterized coiled-coil DUF342 family protein